MPRPGLGAEIARRAEMMGFDLCLFTDSPHLAGDPFAQACLAAAKTSTIRLGTGVTNPVTRSAEVIASAIGTVHVESGGRAVLGLGRGDSAAAQAGRRPASTDRLEACAGEVRGYLGESGIGWLAASGLPPVPIDVACTGPRSIAAAVRTADRVSLLLAPRPNASAGLWQRLGLLSQLPVARGARCALAPTSTWSSTMTLGELGGMPGPGSA